jgi:phosphoglycolate phosphatase-like HAD superfamily hydrolase
MRERRVLFWDFDGVIKESVDVKTRAYGNLFAPFGSELATRVRMHHERNGGVSRFEKIPLYMRWARLETTSDAVESYCRAFAASVKDAVIRSSWVPGAREYLLENAARQRFVLLTATPQDEIEDILTAIGIGQYFAEVHGAPTPKSNAIVSVLSRLQCGPERALVIGDSDSDEAAAATAGVDFLLRCTPLNWRLQRMYGGPQCSDFLDE